MYARSSLAFSRSALLIPTCAHGHRLFGALHIVLELADGCGGEKLLRTLEICLLEL